MTKPEACAKCGSLDISGWVTGKPLSFKRSPRHKNRDALPLPFLLHEGNVDSKSTRRSTEAPRSVAIRWRFAIRLHWTVWKALRMGGRAVEGGAGQFASLVIPAAMVLCILVFPTRVPARQATRIAPSPLYAARALCSVSLCE